MLRPATIRRALLLLPFLVLGVEPVGAQEKAGHKARPWWALWSTTSVEDRLIPVMWTLHLDDPDEGWSNDRTVALIYRGFYAGTFRTTHGPRAWTLGVERSWIRAEHGRLAASLGYRAGLVYGYDERLGWMAGKYPVLPFAQPFVYAGVGPIGLDVAYTWVVLSITAGVRF